MALAIVIFSPTHEEYVSILGSILSLAENLFVGVFRWMSNRKAPLPQSEESAFST
jgi:hypothetical protein